jgi:uncharacterized protein YodC (DUF2158 family)
MAVNTPFPSRRTTRRIIPHEASKAMNFKTGDIVQLKSGGRGLTVVKQTGAQVDLVWYGENDDTLHTGTVPADCLALIQFDDEDLEDDDE